MNYKKYLLETGTLKPGEGHIDKNLEPSAFQYYQTGKYSGLFVAENNGHTKRWKLPVKVYTGGIERAELALHELTQRIGLGPLFELVDEIPTNGLVFIEGLACSLNADGELCADENTLGGVSRNHDDCSICFSVSEPNGSELAGLYYIHLGSHYRENGVPDYQSLNCAKRHHIAMHELSHALGLCSHYHDFGKKSDIGKHTFRALRTLYSNEIGTPFDKLTVPHFHDESFLEKVKRVLSLSPR